MVGTMEQQSTTEGHFFRFEYAKNKINIKMNGQDVTLSLTPVKSKVLTEA
jgi:hypothetical protein